MDRKFGFYVATAALAAIASFSPVLAQASSASGPIKNVTIKGTNFAVIMLTSATGSRPACHTASIYEYAFDISTSKGRALLSTAQAAMMSGKQTTVTGGTTCTTIGSSVIETVQTISVGSIFD